VGELAELDALNKELAEKGGALIGVNTFTLDGDEAAISEEQGSPRMNTPLMLRFRLQRPFRQYRCLLARGTGGYANGEICRR